MRVLLDTNVVLDSLLVRAPWNVDANEILRRAQPGVVDLAISALSVANIFYIGRKAVGVTRARQDVRRCLGAFEILAIDLQILSDADAILGPDFEDNVQIAAAVVARVDYIATRNPAHFSGSSIPAVTPQQLIAMLPP